MGTKQILDLGCGKGHFTHYLFSKGYNVTGVDISTKIVNYAKKTYPRCRFLVHNVETTPLKHKYDFIYSMQVLEHIFDLNRFLTNISQALNPKGILILATPNILAPKIRLKVLFGIDSTFRDLAHLRFFSPSHLKEIVIKNGFKIEELTGTGRLSLLSVNLSGNVLLTVSKL